MEFEINFDAVEKITSQEYAQARAELAEAGPIQALRQSTNACVARSL
jgi:hypothetical protein